MHCLNRKQKDDTYLRTRSARGRGNAQAHTKIKIRKFLLRGLWPFIRNFAPTKISRYTVHSCGSTGLTFERDSASVIARAVAKGTMPTEVGHGSILK